MLSAGCAWAPRGLARAANMSSETMIRGVVIECISATRSRARRGRLRGILAAHVRAAIGRRLDFH